jgi:hypothetical protein
MLCFKLGKELSVVKVNDKVSVGTIEGVES